MDSNTKSILKKINNSDSFFFEILKKVTIDSALSNNECSYILSLSILLYEEYINKNKIGFMEFSYYLVLNYSLKTNDYTPLLMFSINNGLYPISKSILNNYDKNIHDVIFEEGINFYRKGNIYELKKQFESKKKLIESKAQNRAFIAPTSYGKSSAIIEDISKNQANKIGIIVPKKALIWQTFSNVKDLAKKLNYKVLLHDTDYCNEERVICIFTQERAVRLLQDTSFFFESLYIDEAHNIFEKDDRNILLARLIKLNKKINPNHRVIYLSPLIKDANDLIFDSNDIVDTHRIDFNIKEFKIKLLNKNNNLEVYNRFVDKYYLIKNENPNYLQYVFNNLGEKNLFYFNKPKDIESFASKLLLEVKSGTFPIINGTHDKELNEISNMIAKYVAEEYTLVELIKYGIVYVHGKMPDLIKDYLITRFSSIEGMRILISNSSILEGMNLSIDTMFIFDVFRLTQNDLINLCGRVNRLSDVFSQNDLSRLLCNIHFIDIGLNKVNFKNKISLLRSDESDDLKNPLLYKTHLDEKEKKIAQQENDYIEKYHDNDIKTLLVKNGIAYIYKDIDVITSHIKSVELSPDFKKLDIIHKIYEAFFIDNTNVLDFELARLNHEKTIAFYTLYLNEIYHLDLKHKVAFFYSHFEKSQAENYFIGESFGEIPSEFNPNKKVYVDIKNKSKQERVNLAVIKTKIEDDFVGYKLGKLVKMLLDLKLIDENEYNTFIYGTNDSNKLSLYKLGISPLILNIIQEFGLQNDFSLKDGMIVANEHFKEIINQQDDYVKFEVNKYVF